MLRPELFHFEMPEDGGGAPLAPEGEAAEPSWAGPSQDEWGELQQAVGYLSNFVQSQQAPQHEEEGPQIDPFGENFGEQLGAFIQQAVGQAIAPVTEWQQAQQLNEAEEKALDILEDIASREGEFTEQERAFQAARALANVFLPEQSEKYGYGPKAAEAALAKAATFIREYEQAIGNAYVERHMNQLTNLSGAGREPGAGSVGAQQVVTEPGGDELAVVRKYGGFPGVRG